MFASTGTRQVPYIREGLCRQHAVCQTRRCPFRAYLHLRLHLDLTSTILIVSRRPGSQGVGRCWRGTMIMVLSYWQGNVPCTVDGVTFLAHCM